MSTATFRSEDDDRIPNHPTFDLGRPDTVLVEWDRTALPLRLLVDQARMANLDRNADVEMVFLLPDDRLPGVTELEGVPVVRHDGEPMLAFRQSVPRVITPADGDFPASLPVWDAAVGSA
jgi:hypothetical protein